MLPICVTALLVAFSALGIDYDGEIFPFYEAMTAGKLVTSDKLTLDYRKHEIENERGAIVFVPGYTQSHVQYAELMHHFAKLGFSIYIMDHRGHGFSSRVAKNPKMIHVNSFFDYVTDLKKFVDGVVKKKAHHSLFLFAHSMGGQVSMIYQTKYPRDFHAVVLNSPLVELIAGKYSETKAYWLARAMALAGKGAQYGKGQHDPDFATMTFENQTATHSTERFAIKRKIWERFPETMMGGPSYRWLYRTIEASGWMRAHAPAAIDVPLVMFVSQEDTRVKKERSEELCRKIRTCELVQVAGAHHETLWETDEIRTPVIEKIEAFLDKHR